MTVVNAAVGAVTDTSAWVRGKVDASTTLRVADNPSMSGAASYSADLNMSISVASAEATGLDPDTAYWYEFEDFTGDSLSGRFHTHGPPGEPYSFTFAYVVCAGLQPTYPGPSSVLLPDRISTHPVFDDVANRADDLAFVIHGGDLHYYNIGGKAAFCPPATVESYRRGYDDVFACQGRLYRNVPWVYMWDDHDYGPNNSDREAPGREYAAQVYRERVPHYPLAEPGGVAGASGVHHSFVVGRVLFVVLDIRYYRDPSNDPAPRTMLGSAQLSWLDSELGAHPECELLVVVQGQNWTSKSDGATWGAFAAERDDIVTMFGDHGWLNRMLMLVGDNHAMAIDSGGGNEFGRFPIYLLAPVDSGLGGGPSGYDLGRRGSTTGGSHGQWGTVNIADYGSIIRATGNGWYWA